MIIRSMLIIWMPWDNTGFNKKRRLFKEASNKKVESCIDEINADAESTKELLNPVKLERKQKGEARMHIKRGEWDETWGWLKDNKT